MVYPQNIQDLQLNGTDRPRIKSKNPLVVMLSPMKTSLLNGSSLTRKIYTRFLTPSLFFKYSMQAFSTKEDYSMRITDDKLTFLSHYTGIKDLKALKEHVENVCKQSNEGYYKYKCIEEYLFLTPRICEYDSYDHIKKTLTTYSKKSQSNISYLPCYLDVGTCFAQDPRFLLTEGVLGQQIDAIDVHDGYWKLGIQIFYDTPSKHQGFLNGSFPFNKQFEDIRFFVTDIARSTSSNQQFDLKKNRYAVISCTAVLHVLSKRQTEDLLTNIYNMLQVPGIEGCPNEQEPGRLVGWTHGSATVEREWVATPDNSGQNRWLHTEQSLADLLKRIGFKKVNVSVKPLHEWSNPNTGGGVDEATMHRIFFDAQV